MPSSVVFFLYDETKKGEAATFQVLYDKFLGNSFLVFLDNNNEDSSDWIDDLHNDMIIPSLIPSLIRGDSYLMIRNMLWIL